jgi:hypothetical protein
MIEEAKRIRNDWWSVEKKLNKRILEVRGKG